MKKFLDSNYIDNEKGVEEINRRKKGDIPNTLNNKVI